MSDTPTTVKPTIVGFYTPGAACGVTETLLRVAEELKRTPYRVLIIDANLQTPGINIVFIPEGQPRPDPRNHVGYAARWLEVLQGTELPAEVDVSTLSNYAGVPLLGSVGHAYCGEAGNGGYGGLLDTVERAELGGFESMKPSIQRLYQWICTVYPADIILVDMARSLYLHSITLQDYVLHCVVGIFGSSPIARALNENFRCNAEKRALPLIEISVNQLRPPSHTEDHNPDHTQVVFDRLVEQIVQIHKARQIPSGEAQVEAFSTSASIEAPCDSSP